MKKLISVVLSVVILLAAVPLCAMPVLATDGYYTYSSYNGETTITDVDTSISGEVVIPDTLGGTPVTAIEMYAFSKCVGIVSVVVPEGVKSIGPAAFQSCTALERVFLPDSVTYIGKQAFDKTAFFNNSANWNNGSLYAGNHLIKVNTSVTGEYNVMEGTVTLADFAISGCTGVTAITIPDSVVSLSNHAITNCTALKNITVGEYNQNYCDIDGVLFSKDKATLISYPAGRTEESYAIPDSVDNLSYYAFAYCTSLKEIIIPKTVKTVGQYVFYKCSGLNRVSISKSVTTIDSYAFYDCSKLGDVWYEGTEEDKENIRLYSYNPSLTDANWHYECCTSGFDHSYVNDCDAKCDVCGKERAIKHIFDNNDDTQCNICGIVRAAAPVLEAVTDSSVTLVAVEGYEYSVDGKNWQTSNIFSGLNPATAYTFYQRLIDNDEALISLPLTVETEEKTYITGDLDGDGKVNTSDLAMLKLCLAAVNEFTDHALLAGDINGDGSVNTSDLAQLKINLAGV